MTKAQLFGKGSNSIKELVTPPRWEGNRRIEGKLSCGHSTMFPQLVQRCYACWILEDEARRRSRLESPK